MAAGQGDEDVFEADLPGRQPGEGAALGVEVVEQGGDGAVGLADGQGVAVPLGAGREDRRQAGEGGGVGRRRVAAERELDDVLAAEPRDQVGAASPGR